MHEEGTFENYYSTYNLIKVFKIEKKIHSDWRSDKVKNILIYATYYMWHITCACNQWISIDNVLELMIPTHIKISLKIECKLNDKGWKDHFIKRQYIFSLSDFYMNKV